ncbi:MAG TPA: alpha-glucosidase [Clostridia bacterium]|nr:alpha-glucosidase [Clostridia bacterium]
MKGTISKEWYKEMSVYQIWPRSFCDSNGDGIGDLEGVLSKLDYIKSLNVDAIWFSPLFSSPNADYGYDISDYRNISKDYGDIETFKKVLDEAHKRGLKVIIDLVINHTSDEHEWFKKSMESEDSPYHDYYFWRKGKGKNRPPNNWSSLFEGGAWEYNEKLDKYYLHIFAKKQPDLNMDNPKVRQEVKDIMKFWLDMGVDGFREDVITYISKKEGLPDGFPLPAARGMEHYSNGPHVHEYLTEFKKDVLEPYGAFTVGEAPMMTPKIALKYIKEGPDQKLNMMFHFQHMEADCFKTDWLHIPFSLKKLKKTFSTWQKELYGKGWNALYIENHDHPRIIDRFGDLKYRVESGKMLATMYICQSGTPFIYQGQEIGMTNIKFRNFKNFKDVLTFNNYRLFKKLGFSDKRILKITNRSTRENSRTPMQWDGSQGAGFTTGVPWFSINSNYRTINVEAAEKNPDSLLNYYRNLLRIRKENPIIIYGDYKEHYKSSNTLYVYERNFEGKRLLVINSFTKKPKKFKAPEECELEKGELLLNNYKDVSFTDNGFTTKPYETRVYLFK